MAHASKSYQSAYQAYQQGQLDEAIGILQPSAASNEDTQVITLKAADLILMGKIVLQKGKFLGDDSLIRQTAEWLNNFQEDYNDANHPEKLNFQLLQADYLATIKSYQEAADLLSKATQESAGTQNTIAQVKLLCAQSKLHISQNRFDDALKVTEQAYDLMLEKKLDKNEEMLSDVYFQLSQIFVKKQEYGRILDYSQSLLDISRRRKDVEKELVALNNIAIFYAFKSDYKKAMRYFLDTLEKSKEIQHRPIASQCLINIGTIYAHLDNQREAERRYISALEDYEDVLPLNTRVITLNNLGNANLAMERFTAAQTYLLRALELADQVNYREMLAKSAAQLSRAYIAEGNWDAGRELAAKAQGYLKDFGDLNGRQINLINLGAIHLHEKSYDQAIILTSQGIAASNRLQDSTSEIRGYRVLAKVYKDLEDYEQAYQYQTIYAQAQERYLRERRNRQVLDLEIKYAIRDKQKEIEQLLKENEFQSLLLEQSEHIANQNAQLLQVNEELRQFAYVASHDLKEPLRMIGSYVQLIHRRHKNDFDEESSSFFDFVREGTTRMNTLLDALLRYATIGKSEEDFEKVVLRDVLDLSIINLRVRIEETGAEVEVDDLPNVHSIKSLLIQLFQNLIANAIKFRKPDTIPHIRIEASENAEEHILSIADNGIGIAPEFQEKIFIIFKRLHTRVKYEGAGIGLSICQKIVQRLGGRIWVESKAGEGATFFIALPKSQKEISE